MNGVVRGPEADAPISWLLDQDLGVILLVPASDHQTNQRSEKRN